MPRSRRRQVRRSDGQRTLREGRGQQIRLSPRHHRQPILVSHQARGARRRDRGAPGSAGDPHEMRRGSPAMPGEIRRERVLLRRQDCRQGRRASGRRVSRTRRVQVSPVRPAVTSAPSTPARTRRRPRRRKQAPILHRPGIVQPPAGRDALYGELRQPVRRVRRALRRVGGPRHRWLRSRLCVYRVPMRLPDRAPPWRRWQRPGNGPRPRMVRSRPPHAARRRQRPDLRRRVQRLDATVRHLRPLGPDRQQRTEHGREPALRRRHSGAVHDRRRVQRRGRWLRLLHRPAAVGAGGRCRLLRRRPGRGRRRRDGQRRVRRIGGRATHHPEALCGRQRRYAVPALRR